MSLADAMPRSNGPLVPREVAVPGVGRLPVVVWLYLASIALPVGFDIGSLSMSFMRALLLITIIPLFFTLISGRAGRVLPTDIFFILHILWAVVAMAVNSPNQVVENMGSTSAEFLGGYLIGRTLIRTPETFAAFSRALFALVIISLPFVLLESQNGVPIILEAINSVPGLTTYVNIFDTTRMGLERSQWVFAHPIHYGLFCSVGFSLCVVAFKGIFADTKRWVMGVLIGTCTFLALSSGALLALAMQLGLISWAWIFRNHRHRWWYLVGLFVLAYIVVDLLSSRTPIKVFMTYATFSAWNAYWRSIIFEWGMINVWANPFFGLGLRNWVRPSYMSSGSMDNFWLVMAVRYGIPGFLFIVLGYAAAIRRIMRRDFSMDPVVTQFRLAWVFTFLGLSFTLCTVHIWTAIYSFVFMMLGSGMWMATYQPAAAAGTLSGQPAAAGPEPRGAARPVVARGGRAPVVPAAVAESGAIAAELPEYGPDHAEDRADDVSQTGESPDALSARRGPAYSRFADRVRTRGGMTQPGTEDDDTTRPRPAHARRKDAK